MNSLATCVQQLERFSERDLRLKLRDIEDHLAGGKADACSEVNAAFGIGPELIEAAAAVKKAAAQIDVIIHSIGILHLLPTILEDGERIQYLSLGAGNTGKNFDLETDRQIAEFTFIAWRGGAEVIRQNKVFVDFFHLAEAPTIKRRNLYVLGLEHPIRFFRGARKLESVLSRRPAEARFIAEHYGDRFRVVRDYFEHHGSNVNILDMSPQMPKSLLAAVEAASIEIEEPS